MERRSPGAPGSGVGRCRWAAWAMVVAALVGLGCSKGEDQAAPPGPPGPMGSEGPGAELTVIDDRVEVARSGQSSFGPGATGDALGIGDRVRADATGFGELSYFDGSWTRLEASATLTIVELADVEEGQAVETAMDGGRLWARAEELTESGDRFEVGTPVGTASVRGTRFAIDCTVSWAQALVSDDVVYPPASGRPDLVCAFTAVEGTVVVALDDGTEVELGPSTRLWVPDDGRDPIGPQVLLPDALDQDDWIARNLARDAALPGAQDVIGGAGEGQEAGATLAKTWDVEVLVATSSDPRVAVGDGDRARWEVEVSCEDTCRGSRRMVDADGQPVLRDGAGREVVDEVVPAGGGRYVITASWTDTCQRDGIDLAPAGTAVERVGSYVVTEARFVEGRWTATEMEGTVTTTTALTPEGQAAGCVLADGVASVAFTTEVVARAA